MRKDARVRDSWVPQSPAVLCGRCPAGYGSSECRQEVGTQGGTVCDVILQKLLVLVLIVFGRSIPSTILKTKPFY